MAFAAIWTLVIIFVIDVAIAKIGQMMGGNGNFRDALVLDVFLQAALLPVLLAMPFFLTASSGPLIVVALVIVVFATWVNLCFVDELHGFESLLKSFALIIMATVISVVLVSIMMAPFASPASAVGGTG